MVQDEWDQLLRDKMSMLHNRMIADRLVSVGLLAAGMSEHRRNSLVAAYAVLELLLKDEICSLPPGSRINLSASTVNGTHNGKQEIQVQISDNGPGIPKEALRVVFDPFVVRSDSPVEYGIHLMACYFIVHHHGGKIDARSGDGQGTTFTLHLPVNPNHAVPSSPTDQDFLQRVLLNDSLWEKLISTEYR